MGALHHDPDRLRAPLVRRADGTFAEASWDEALGRAAEGLAGVVPLEVRHLPIYDEADAAAFAPDVGAIPEASDWLNE